MSNLNLKTGDILLFDHNEKGFLGIFNKAIKYFTSSDYSHVAVVLKDPKLIHPSLKGYYIWESSYAKALLTHKMVKLNWAYKLLHSMKYSITAKKLLALCFYVELIVQVIHLTHTNLKEVHDVVYDKPYDIVPMDWINVTSRTDTAPQKQTDFGVVL